MLLTVADLKSKYNGVFDDVEVFYNEGTAFRGTVSGEFEKGVSDKFEGLILNWLMRNITVVIYQTGVYLLILSIFTVKKMQRYYAY